eukprot:TRINITY_DN3223_c5_g1_i1.p1 TRINITY_DN3223_c5_g1~~TRINITY_DN3223_c5_g1_i1.p1  ORF type:complete len:372 (-),score=86.72 TRINITY_DN3223_c5_g1_i1:399-1514(-)
MAAKSDIDPPVDLGNGKKRYMVHGTTFEVDTKYNITKACGYGAYGFVVAAVNTDTGAKVAIKKCQNVFHDLSDATRVLREISLMSFLSHENTLGIKDLMAPDAPDFSDVYLVTQLMDTDLNNVIRSKQRLTEEHSQYFIYQILRGLKYIHSARIMHRDLKPANILTNVNCDLRICDFGLARAHEPDRQSEMTDYVITRWYRPPELLLMSTGYTEAIDIWSAGCIFAELINRKPLFAGKDYLHQLKLICTDLGVPSDEDLESFITNKEALRYVKTMPKTSPKPITHLCPNLTNELAQDFLAQMLTFNPHKRPSADELLSHPYLHQLHDPNDEPTAPGAFVWDLEQRDFTEKELRQAYWDEIRKYHPELRTTP